MGRTRGNLEDPVSVGIALKGEEQPFSSSRIGTDPGPGRGGLAYSRCARHGSILSVPSKMLVIRKGQIDRLLHRRAEARGIFEAMPCSATGPEC